MTDTAEKGIQRDFYDGLVMNIADCPPSSATFLPKWDTFKNVFLGKIGTMVILNLLTLIFAAPAVALIVWFSFILGGFNGFIPYSSNIGIGYPVVVDAAWRAQAVTFTYNLVEYAALIPCFMLMFIGIGGCLYAMRRLVSGDSKKPAREFFVGVKKTWWRAMLIGLLVGCAVFLFVTTLGIFDYFKLHVAYKVISIIVSSIILVFVAIFSVFYLSQSADFSMKPSVCAKNSALLAIGSHVIGLFFVALALLPMILFFWSTTSFFGMCIYVFVGFSFFSLIVTLLCNDRFDKYLYDRAATVTVYQKGAKQEKGEKDENTGKPVVEKVQNDEKTYNVNANGADGAETEKVKSNNKQSKPVVKYKNHKKGKK